MSGLAHEKSVLPAYWKLSRIDIWGKVEMTSGDPREKPELPGPPVPGPEEPTTLPPGPELPPSGPDDPGLPPPDPDPTPDPSQYLPYHPSDRGGFNVLSKWLIAHVPCRIALVEETPPNYFLVHSMRKQSPNRKFKLDQEGLRKSC